MFDLSMFLFLFTAELCHPEYPGLPGKLNGGQYLLIPQPVRPRSLPSKAVLKAISGKTSG
jgi:hypothetical protein